MRTWSDFTPEELRLAAEVARVSGGVYMAGAAAAWELRADLMEKTVTLEDLLNG